MNATFTSFICIVVAVATCAAAGSDRRSGPAENTELHVVSVYQGRTRTEGKIHGGKANVKVDRPGKTITLVLAAYEPVTWEIQATEGTKLDKVYLGGYHRQAATGIDDKVEVVNAFYEGGDRQQQLRHEHRIESSGFRRFATDIRRLTGQELSSFQGTYTAAAPFVISGVQNDPRLASDYPRPTPAADLPNITFSALHIVPGAHPHSQQASYGEFTLQGPKESTLKPIGEVRSLAIDPDTKVHYGLTMHDLVIVDIAKRKNEKVEVSLDVPRLSWPRCLTFDTKRKRLVVVGDELLYAFTPATKKWEVLSEIERPLGYAGIGYDEPSDMLFALATRFGGGRDYPVIHRINAEGATVDTTKLANPFLPGIVDGGRANPVSQIVPVDGKLVIIAGGGRDPNSGATSTEMFIFLVDPKTEKIWLTHKASKPSAGHHDE